jgi:hypothetical protein
MHLRLSALLFTLGALASCTVMQSKPIAISSTPITWRSVSEVIDEEVIQHSVKFRNTGSQIVSFDYTIVDDGYVPHVDAGGPNSGLIENLYPGEERQVKNNWKDDAVNIQVGHLTYGKRSSEQLAKSYKPWSITPVASGSATGAAGLLPLPQSGE